MGSAKSEVIWDFDLDMIIDRIKNVDADNFNINYVGSFLEIGLPSESFCVNLDNAWKDSFDYILSSHIKHEPVKLRLPRLFLYLFSLILYLEFFQEENSMYEFPHLKMKLKYLDIANNIHKKEFELKFYPNVYHRTSLDLEEYESKYEKHFEIMQGSIEVKEL